MFAQKISAVIITLNEANNIERVIKSIQKVVDEIIILDSGSTDNTIAIATQLGANVIKTEWLGYAQTKNKGHDLAQYDYILSIDADEALSEQLQNSILKIKMAGLDGAYEMSRITNYCGKWIKHSGWYPDKKVRLFPKTTIWEGEFVHETLVLPIEISIKPLHGDILHYSYYNRKEHKARADKYSILTAQKMHKQGKKASFLKPYLSALGRFVSMYFIKKGILDGSAGWHIATISAQSNILKYKTLRKLNHEQ